MSSISAAEKSRLINFSREIETLHDLPIGMIAGMMEIESTFNPNAFNSGSNARGILQHVPSFVTQIKNQFKFDYDPFDPYPAIEATAVQMKHYYKLFGAWDLALMAYNWGPGYIRSWLAGKTKYGRAKIPRETLNYLRKMEKFLPGIFRN